MKKAISVLLSVVMLFSVVTGVNFSASAKERSVYDKYVDSLMQMKVVKSFLSGYEIEVNETTTASDVVAGLSPLVMSLLGDSGDKETILTEYYKDLGYTKKQAASMYEEYNNFGVYDYLNNPNSILDFYSLYKFCDDNDGLIFDSSTRTYAKETLPKLKSLLKAHLDIYNTVFSEGDGEEIIGTDVINSYKQTVQNGGIVFDENLTLYDLENFKISGVKLKNKTDSKCKTRITYDNMYLDFAGAPFQIDNIAADLFYQYNQNYVMGIFYLYLANLGGAEVKYNGEAITVSNYKAVISKSKSYADFCAEKGFAQNEKSASAYDSYCLNEVYNTIFDGSTVSSKIDGSVEFTSPYYNSIAIGALEATKAYDKGAYASAKDFDNAQRISDSQIKDLYNYIKNGGNITDYLSGEDCKFSSYSRDFYKELLGSADYVRSSIELNLQKCADENEAVDVFKRFAISYEFDDFISSDGDDVLIYYFDEEYPSDNATPLYEIANYILPSKIVQVLDDKSEPAFGFFGTANIKYFYEDEYISNYVKNKLNDYKYDYKKYAITDTVAVKAANKEINDIVDYTKPASPVNLIINNLFTSEVDLYNTFNNFWQDLYDDTANTISRAMPTVAIALDELLIPMMFNDETPANSTLYSLANSYVGAFRQYTQEAGDTRFGIGTLSFDLNKIIPAIMNWVLGDEDKTIAAVGTYKAYAPGVNTSIPVFTNVYGLDEIIYRYKYIGNKPLEILRVAIEEYIADSTDYGTKNESGTTSKNKLNNIAVAAPNIIDSFSQKTIAEYGINTNFKYRDNGDLVNNKNVTLANFKKLATSNISASTAFKTYDKNYPYFRKAFSIMFNQKTDCLLKDLEISTVLDNYEDLYHQINGHILDENRVLTVEPNCTEQGRTSQVCLKCGAEKVISTKPALGHTEVIDEGYAATCTEAGLTEGSHCSVCSEVIKERTVIPALGHDFVRTEVIVQPTCTEKGEEHDICSRCGERATRAIEPLGHTEVVDKAVAPTCTAAGLTEGKRCSVCGVTILKQEAVKALGHKSDGGKVTKAATITAEGVKTYSCTVCKAVLKTEVIAKLPKKANTLTLKAKKPTVKFSKLKKKNQTIALKNAITVSKPQGKVTYAKSSGNAKITINKTSGKITVKKGLKKGTYKVKIKVTAAGNATYNKATKTVTVTIKVK